MKEKLPFYLVMSYCFRERRIFLGKSREEVSIARRRRYLAESGDTEEAAASRIGVNHHTLRRWLSDKQSPKKGKLALAAAFLRHAGYL